MYIIPFAPYLLYNSNMFEGTNQQQLLLSTAKKNQTKYTATPKNKQKDKVHLSQSCKRRLSTRQSQHQKIAWIQFKGLGRCKKNKRHRQSNGKPTINLELVQRIEELAKQVELKNKYIEELTKKITHSLEILAQSKKIKQKSRRYFLENKELIRMMEYNINIEKQICNEIKIQTDNIHFEGKKITFEMISEENNLNLLIEQNTEKTMEKRDKLHKCFRKFEELTSDVTKMEYKMKELTAQLEKCEKTNKEITQNYNIEMSQLFVLKFQLNPTCFYGLVMMHNGADRRLMLERDYSSWDKHKQRKIDYNDLKRFVLIQLYRGWKGILRKLSYQSSQYQVLFGEVESGPVLEDLKRFLSEEKVRVSYKKWQKAIVFYSQTKIQVNRREIIKNLFKNFNNSIIQIQNVDFIEFQGIVQMEIRFIYMQTQQAIEKFIFEEHNYISKEKIMRDIKSTDRRTFCLIEVPSIGLKEDCGRYLEIYDLIKKIKNK